MKLHLTTTSILVAAVAAIAATGGSLVHASMNGTASCCFMTSRVHVHIPYSLHKPDGYLHVQGTFGNYPQETGSMSLQVHHYPHQLCDLPTWQNTTREWEVKGEAPHPFMLAVPEGLCSHVTKARYAQIIGASGLILLSDQCLCNDHDCVSFQPSHSDDNKKKDDDDDHKHDDDHHDNTKNSTDDNSTDTNHTIASFYHGSRALLSVTDDSVLGEDNKCLDEPPPLYNDGSGNDITIPTFLIYKDLSSKLNEQGWNKGQPVLMELQWGLKAPVKDAAKDPNKLDVATHLYTSAYDPYVDLETYKNLRAVHDAFKDKIEFEPRYSFVNGGQFKCTGTGAEHCSDLCTNNGRYCTPHAHGLSGRVIMKETLRRLCIWKHYSILDYGKSFWDYVLYFKEHCEKEFVDANSTLTPSEFDNHDCLVNAMASAGMNQQTIEQCMIDSGNVETDVSNSLFDTELAKVLRSGVTTLPTLAINHRHYELSTGKFFEVVCTTYWDSNVLQVPDMCTKCSGCENIPGCLKNNGKCVAFDNSQRSPEIPTVDPNAKGDAAKSGGGFFAGLFRFIMWTGFIGLLAGGGYVYYKKRQDEMGYGGGGGGNGGLLGNYMHLGTSD